MKYAILFMLTLGALLYHQNSYATVLIQPRHTGPTVLEPAHPNHPQTQQHQQGPTQTNAADHQVNAIGVVIEEHRDGYKVYIKQDMGGKHEFASHETLYLPKSIIQGHPLKTNQEILITHVTDDKHVVETGHTKVIVGVDINPAKPVVTTSHQTTGIKVNFVEAKLTNDPTIGGQFTFLITKGDGLLKKGERGRVSAKVLEACQIDEKTTNMRKNFAVAFYITKVSELIRPADHSIQPYREVLECENIMARRN
ncbi:MAG: hypothetical protein ACK5O7_05875 [Holosporales bacterium]